MDAPSLRPLGQYPMPLGHQQLLGHRWGHQSQHRLSSPGEGSAGQREAPSPAASHVLLPTFFYMDIIYMYVFVYDFLL